MSNFDIRAYNRRAWDKEVQKGNRWTLPVGPEVIAAARLGNFEVLLTPQKPVPKNWFPPLKGRKVLALASAGGQQAPIFAAAGAKVTVLDNSPAQLGRDREVAEREQLTLELLEGDMRDLSAFPDQSFQLIFHPVSNCFVPEIRSIWQESFRVLEPGGILLAGVTHPLAFLIDPDRESAGELVIKYSVPYADVELPERERRRYTDASEPLCYGHSLEDQLGGQLDAGFVLTGLYEDTQDDLLGRHCPAYLATRALRPK